MWCLAAGYLDGDELLEGSDVIQTTRHARRAERMEA